MSNARTPGPMCQVLQTPVFLADGTQCLCASPLPGVISEEPEVSDHFAPPLGVDASKPLGEEVWFEHRYPNLLEDSRSRFVVVVDDWAQNHWGQCSYEDQKQRISVNARDTVYPNKDGSPRQVKKTDNRFERCGDKPQTVVEADQLLGGFWLDIETPLTINYSTTLRGGKDLGRFEWTAVMYVGDVLGFQKDNWAVHKLGDWTLSAAPSRTVTRARWYISGTGYSYMVAKGDSLSAIAQALTGNMDDWKKIHDANRSTISDPNRISPGQRIIIPAELVK